MKNLIRLVSRSARLALLLALVLALGACDGGLFGTGDGGPIIPTDAGAPPTTGGEDVGGSDTGGNTGGDPGASPTTPGNGVDSNPLSFENLDVSTEDPGALINVLNYSSSNLVVRVDTSTVDSDTIAANSTSAAISITPDTSSLSLVDSSDTVIVEFLPFTAAAQSLSTIVVREDDNGINAIAVRSEVNTDDASVAKVRVIQVGQLGDATRSADIILQPTGTNPGPADVILSDVSFNTNAVTNYVTAGGGDYLLTDSGARVAPITITLDGGVVYSIVLTDRTDAGVLLIKDSDLINQSR